MPVDIGGGVPDERLYHIGLVFHGGYGDEFHEMASLLCRPEP
jgi:hypothetical protein